MSHITRLLSLLAALSCFLGGVEVRAEVLPPESTVLLPVEFKKGNHPSARVVEKLSWQGVAVPYVALFEEWDLRRVDPTVLHAAITGVKVLPILNPNPSSHGGSYTAKDFANIRQDNYSKYFAFLPGQSLQDRSTGFISDLTSNVLSVWIKHPGPYAFAVQAIVVKQGHPIHQQEEFFFGAMLDDGYFLDKTDPDVEDPPVHIQRILPLPPAGFELKSTALDTGNVASDVNVISNDTVNNTAPIQSTQSILSQAGYSYTMVGNADDVATAVCKKAAEAGHPVSVTIYCHSSEKGLLIGNQIVGEGGISPRQLGEKLKGRVTSIRLFSCDIGKNTAFVAELAQCAGCPVVAYNCHMTAARYVSTGLGAYFDADAEGNAKVVKDPTAGTEPDGGTHATTSEGKKTLGK